MRSLHLPHRMGCIMEGMCSMKSRCQRTTGRVKVEEIMGRDRGRAERVMGRKTREVLLKEEVLCFSSFVPRCRQSLYEI